MIEVAALKPVVHWTDSLIFLLVALVIVFAVYVSRQEHLRGQWLQVIKSGFGMGSMMVLLAYVAIGLLDSLHYREALPDTGNNETTHYSGEVLSALDWVLGPIRTQVEKTYSAPFAAHLAVGPRHWLYSRRARPVRYRRKQYQTTTWAARSMMISGVVLLMFLVVHIAHVRGWLMFTDGDSVYQNLRAGFTYLPIVVIYLLGQLALAMHLFHGLWSQFQTLGIHHPRYNHLRRPIAAFVGIGIALLNSTLVLLNMDPVQRLLERLS